MRSSSESNRVYLEPGCESPNATESVRIDPFFLMDSKVTDRCFGGDFFCKHSRAFFPAVWPCNAMTIVSFKVVRETFSILSYLSTYLPTYVRTYLPTYVRTYVPTYLRTYLPIYDIYRTQRFYWRGVRVRHHGRE